MTPGTGTPRGVGIYTSRIVREWGPATARKEIGELLGMRASHVALCAEASDGWTADHGVLVDIADHLRDAGIQAHVYALLGKLAWSEPEAAADRLADAGIACKAAGWQPDIEEQARGLGAQVARFRARLMDRASEAANVGPTFYGLVPAQPSIPRAGDGLFPWAEIVGWGTAYWQCYEKAGSRALVRRALAAVRHHWGADVIPLVASYERRDGGHGPKRLDEDIARTCLDDAGAIDVPGVWVWQDSTTDAAERAVLAAWALRFADADVERRRDEVTQRIGVPR